MSPETPAVPGGNASPDPRDEEPEEAVATPGGAQQPADAPEDAPQQPEDADQQGEGKPLPTPPTADKAAPQKPSELVDEELRVQDEKTKEAEEKADGANISLKDQKGRLQALQSLRNDIDQAVLAYSSAHEQLKIDQQAYLDFQDAEKDSLEDELGSEGVADATEKSEAKKADDNAAVANLETKNRELAAAETKLGQADERRKEKTADLAAWRQLAASISARHAKLKAIREEVSKAHQAGEYALAYWLLQLRGDYHAELEASRAALINPTDMPRRLLDATNALADAENDHAEKENTVARCRKEVADAEKRLADQKSNGEARLREALKQTTPANA